MSQLLMHKENLVFPPLVAAQDTSWAYIHSYTNRPANISDLDAKNYKYGGANASIAHHSHQSKAQKKDPIDRFASIIDAEDPRFDKQRKENYKSWESGVQNLCLAMNRSIDAFYDRKSEVYSEIVASSMEKRDDYAPQVDIAEMTDEIKELALAPWIFQTLPGTKPSQWPTQLETLNKRLGELPPLALWNEPLDLICGGPEFFDQAHDFIKKHGNKLNTVKPGSAAFTDLVSNTSQAISSVFAISVLTANHELILNTLELILNFTDFCQHSDLVFNDCQGTLKRYMKQLQDVVSNNKKYHYMQASSTFGVISIAKYVSFVNMNENNSSITTDGDYIYLYISITQRGGMYKIGTGENNTLAGKVYLHTSTEREGEVSWVYCQGKLYSRRANEELGQVLIIDPLTFKQEGMAKLFCGETFQSQAAQSLNRYYPLLTDGQNLYIVTMNVIKKRRRVKDSMRKQYQQLQEDKKQKKEDEKKGIIIAKAAAILTEEKKAAQPKDAKEKPHKKERIADLQSNVYKDMAKFKDPLIAYQLTEDKAQQDRLMKELKKKKIKDQKSEMHKKVQEAQKAAKEMPPSGPAAEWGGEQILLQQQKLQQEQLAAQVEQIDPDSYKVCEFQLHEFDIRNQGDDSLQIAQLLEIEGVAELFESFSGFFGHQECYKALKFNNNDICEAASWLVEEGEKERGKKSLMKKRSILLGESEILTETLTKKNETDVCVKPDSILYPTNITSGKWTISKDNITYHNLVPDNGYVKIFSTKDEDLKVINQKLEASPASDQAAEEVVSINTESQQQQVEAAPSLVKQKTAADQSIKGLLVKAAADKLVSDAEKIKEEDMYEDIKLYGTLIKTIKNQRTPDHNYSTYITYDHVYKKFYLLLLGHNQRYIAVANDFIEMETLYKSISDISANLDKYNESKTFAEFVINTLSTLQAVGSSRFNMQWRWRPWSSLYLQVIQQWGLDYVDQGGDQDHQSRAIIENKKNQINKLTSRLEKVSLREKQIEGQQIGLYFEIEKQPAAIEKRKSSKNSGGKKKIAAEKGFSVNSANPSYGQDLVQPAQQISLQRETKKLYTFCVNGDVQTLQVYFKWLKQADSKILPSFKQIILESILEWVIYADILSIVKDSALIDEIQEHLFVRLTDKDTESYEKALLWKILIIGQPIFVRSTDQQFKLFEMILQDSKDKKSDLKGITDKQISSASKKQSQISFYQRLAAQDISPIQLFWTRFYYYPQSFFPLEILLQSKVTNLIFLLDKNSTKGEEIKENQITESESGLKPLYHKYKDRIDGSLQYKRWNAKLTDIKEFYEKEVNVGNINHNYFSMPISSAMVGDYQILEDLENCKQMPSLTRLIKLYSNKDIQQLPSDPKEKHEYLLKILGNLRNKHHDKSHQLFNSFKDYIKKSLVEDDQWNQEVSPFVIKTFHELLQASLSQIDWSLPQYTNVAVESVQFVEDLLNSLLKKTNGFKLPFKESWTEWLVLVQDLLHMIVSMIFPALECPALAYFAKECTRSLLKIFEIVKQLFVFQQQEGTSSSPEQTIKTSSLLEKAYVFLSEGADFTNEKIFETPHPYPRGESYLKEVISIPRAIAFSIELDKRCHTEFSSDYLVIQSQDHAFWVNDTFGTNIRFYGKPQIKYPFMILGNKLTIEFRSYPHGKKSRGGGPGQPSSLEDLQTRWGFRLMIRPIYGEPSSFLSSVVKGDVLQQVFKRVGGEEQVRQWVSLLNSLIFLASVFSKTLTKAIMPSNDLEEPIMKFTNWHLFKGGLRLPELEASSAELIDIGLKQKYLSIQDAHQLNLQAKEEYKDPSICSEKAKADQIDESKEALQVSNEFIPNKESRLPEIEGLLEDHEFINLINKKIREHVPYTITYTNEKKRPNFLKSYQEEWIKVEELLIVAMLYHSNSVEDAKRYLQGDVKLNSEQVIDKFRLIGSQINEVLAWMQSRIQGEQDFQSMLKDIVEQAQTYINKTIQKKKEEEVEKQRVQAELDAKNKQLEEEQKLQSAKDEEQKQKLTQQEQNEKQKKAPVVSKQSKVTKSKRKNVMRISQEVVKPKKIKKKQPDNEIIANQEEELKQEEKPLKDLQDATAVAQISEESKENNAISGQQQIKVKYLELSKQEEQEIKNKVYNKVYEEFLQLYEGNQDRVKPLCLLLNIQFNPEDPNESLKAIFKRVKNKLKILIDFDGDLPLKEYLDTNELKLESPYKEVSKEVQGRMQFLLELKQSIDYQNKVLQVDLSQMSRKFVNNSIQRILTQNVAGAEVNDDQSSQHVFTESSMHGDDDNDSAILEPLGIQRSQSVQVGLQPSFHGISGASQAVIAAQNNMKEEDIVNWIDSYRKWRQWNRYHKQLNKNGLGALDLEEDLTSPFCSPLFSIVAFAKASKIVNPEEMREIFREHQIKASFRIQGLQIQEQLLQLATNTPFQRFVWGSFSSTLQQSAFLGVEACGEHLSKQLNECSRLLVKQLMTNVIQSRRYIENIMAQFSKYAQAKSDQLSQQQLSTQEKVKSPSSKIQTSEEWMLFEQLKRLVHTLNDIRILLNNVYTREYILETLRQGQLRNSQLKDLKAKKDDNQLGIDTIKNFLKSIVQLMLLCQGSSSLSKISPQSTRLNFAIAHCSKLILNQFMKDESMMRSNEIVKLLQEMLMDIVVALLEKICGIKSPIETEELSPDKKTKDYQQQSRRPSQNFLARHHYQEELVQLLKLLSEVIRISNDTQQQLKSIQQISPALEKEQSKDTFFLSEGSQKVMRCAQMLIYLMHNIEVPVVMRQAIKCAKLFFKLVDFKQLKLHISGTVENTEAVELQESTNDTNQSANQFLVETLKLIGAKISNTQQKERPKEGQDDEKLYVVYANINSSEEDFTFLITTLYHWETLYPTFTQDLPKNPSDIVVKSKPKEENKDEVKEENKDEKDDLDSQQEKLLQQIVEMENNTDLQELINIQKQQILQNSSSRGGRGGYRGGYGRGGADIRASKREPPLPYPSEAYKKQATSKYGFEFLQKQNASIFGQSGHGYQANAASYYGAGIQPFASTSNIGIIKLDQLYDEVVKMTWEDAKEEDSEEEQLRKLNEKNYNTRIIAHIKEAVQLAAVLYLRYSAPVTEPLPYKKALQFSNLLQRAYKGTLEQIQINPYMKQENKDKKLPLGKTIAQVFPLAMINVDVAKKAKELTPGSGAPILIAPKQLVVSLAEKRISQRYEQVVETKTQALKNLEKNPIEGFNCNVIHQSIRRQGSSISVIIQECIQLIRSLVTKNGSVKQQPGDSQQQQYPSENFKKQKSMMKVQKQQEQFQEEYMMLFNDSIEKLSTQSWVEFSVKDQQVVFGLLAVIGGWQPYIKTGQPVQVEINNQWCDAKVVDDGIGKKRISVILDDDETLQVIKIPVSKSRTYQKYEWPFYGELGAQIDQEQLCKAIINVYNQLQKLSSTEPLIQDDCSILNEKCLILMLLKISSQINWTLLDRTNSTLQQFMSILMQITQEQQSEEDKTKVYWEKAMMDSWERLIDKDEDKNHEFFVIRENFLKKIINEETKDNLITATDIIPIDTTLVTDNVISKDEINSSQTESLLPVVPKEDESIKAQDKLKAQIIKLSNEYIDSDFVQPLSSYLKGLPEPIPKKNQSEAALKLLAYWEKNIVPKIIEFVRTTYKSWEMEFYFEQLRHHLRHGDSQKALEDALTMCERKMPQGCTVPDEHYDWTSKMIDECIVDSWALAKFKPVRHSHVQSGSAGQSAQTSSSSSNQAGETNFPLLNKLINFGIDEIVVLIKAVDLRGNVVLAEYQDPDTMQVHSLWIPVSHLNNLHTPLPPRAVGFSIKTLKNMFMYNSFKVDSIYARKTLIQFFQAFQTFDPLQELSIIHMPSPDMKIQELISWSVWEEFSNAPITGWMRDLYCAIPYSSKGSSSLTQKTPKGELEMITQQPLPSPSKISINSISTSATNLEFSSLTATLQEIVEQNSEEIVFEQLLNQQKDSNHTSTPTLGLIKTLFETTIGNIDEKVEGTLKSGDVQILSDIVDWCVVNWYQLSERIKQDRAVFDICKEYDSYVNKQLSSQDDEGIQLGSYLMPLHELIINENRSSESTIGTLIMFKKNGANLTPTSKVQFYSDPNKVNLESEINAGSEGKRDLQPLLLNHGHIWVQFDAGTTALLAKHQQTDQKSSLPCAVVQIPSTWTVCCWLTETITNALLTNISKATNFSLDIFNKLICALVTFYEEAKAPSILKSIILTLLSRLIRKLRHIYQQQPNIEAIKQLGAQPQQHLQKLFVSQDFISQLLSEVLLQKEQEEAALSNQGQQVLYSAFIQDCVELILTIMMPTVKDVRVNSYKDLINANILSMPEWIEPLIKVAYFMHYFSNETPLPLELLKEVHNETKLTGKQLDYILVIQNIPLPAQDGNDKYSQDWIRAKIIQISAENGAKILNPEKDIVFVNSDTAVVIIDQFDHMNYGDDDDEQNPVEEDSETENEEEGEEQKKEEAKDEVKEEVLMPSIWSCDACTLINRIDLSVCDICGSNRPPMEKIIADFQAELNIGQPQVTKAEDQADNVADGQELDKPHHLVKLQKLANQFSKIVSKEQRRIVKEERLLEKTIKEAEELKQKNDLEQQKLEAEKNQIDKPEVNKELLKSNAKSSSSKMAVIPEENSNQLRQNEDSLFDDKEDPDAIGGEEEEEIIDPLLLERHAKLIDLGIDPQLIQQDPDLAQALAVSMMEEQEQERKKQEIEKQKQADEEAKKRKEEERKERQDSGKERVQYIKLKVQVGQKQVFEDIEASRIVYQVLKDRLIKNDSFENSIELQKVLVQVYNSIQALPLEELELPTDSLFENMEYTIDTIKNMSLEEFIQSSHMLIETDVKQFMIFLETQGYDLWLEKASYPSYLTEKLSNVKTSMLLLEKLKTFIEIDMCKETKAIISLHPTMLRLISKTDTTKLSETMKPVNYYDDSLLGTSYQEINEKLNLADVRYQWALLKVFNKYLAPAVPYINTSQSISDIPHHSIPMTLSAYMSFTRNLGLMNVKFDLRHLILEKTSVQREHSPKLYFERLKIAHRNRENEEADGEESSPRREDQQQEVRVKEKKQLEYMFSQAYEQIKDMDLALLRPKKPQGAEPHLSFHIVFKGEHVVGEGGPYRQFFADISSELQPSVQIENSHQKGLNLLYPSSNNRSRSNIGKGKFVLSPSKNSSHDLSQYEFLGILMGVCIRTGAHLNLDLPQFVWKQLVGQKITHEDIIEIDIGFWKLLSFILSANKKLYDESIFETYSLTLSDESMIEIKENGKEERVQYEDRIQYIKKALYLRMKECKVQCDAIKRGIVKIVPEALLNMVTYNELDTWVCGKNIVDIDLLKRHTKYGGDKKSEILNEDSQRIKWFWEVLREFCEEDKQKFIKFCWGQQRLPANDEEFDRRQVRFMIKPALNTIHGDGSLPKADTCFFNFELPDYSSREIMKQRILLAIHTDCDSMNAEVEHAGNMGNDAANANDDNHSYDDEY